MNLFPPETKILFGLEAQGHIPTIEHMLNKDCSWDEIGKEINWIGDTVKEHYKEYLSRKIKTETKYPVNLIKNLEGKIITNIYSKDPLSPEENTEELLLHDYTDIYIEFSDGTKIKLWRTGFGGIDFIKNKNVNEIIE